MQPLRSARLVFSPFTAEDADGLFALDSDPAVHRYLGGIGGQLAASPAESLAVIRYIQAQYAATGLGRWVVREAATGAFVGWAGLKLVAGPINGHRNFYDLGYRLRPAYWGQGYGTEAAQAWRDHGLQTLRLPRLCAYAHADNRASGRILEKVGLVRGNAFVEGGTPCVWFEARNPYL